MLDVVGNIHMSLTNLESIYVVDNRIHLVNCVASPKLIRELPESEVAQLHIALNKSQTAFPYTLLDKNTQVLISGHLTISSLTHHLETKVLSGCWMVHEGDLDTLVEGEGKKALVSGKVYVAKVCWNQHNIWKSYARVVEPSLGKKIDIQLFPGNPTVLRQIQKLEHGKWILMQGYSARGLLQEDGILKVKFPGKILSSFGVYKMDAFQTSTRSQSTGYHLWSDPKKRFNLHVGDWAP
ncbi:hypothetical protein H4Q26_015521 [Puccinia striiformis f. sp. tritici PST-130]|nr:hypothetical protein H4Q26_015521 [Puccinia striiformis f. sp. tritici PST-130]